MSSKRDDPPVPSLASPYPEYPTLTTVPTPRPHVAAALHVGSSAAVGAIWIATCSAAPELLWRGMKLAVSHFNLTTLLSALLLGVILAFFVEPILERTRDFLEPQATRTPVMRSPHGLLFKAIVSIAFALTSVAVHDAIVAFVSQDDATKGSGLDAAIGLTFEWAIVPFLVALAWQSAQNRWLAIPMGVAGVLSPILAGWLFAWSIKTVIATTIPCLAIQFLGYRKIRRRGQRHMFASCASIVAGVAIVWLLIAFPLDAALTGLGVLPTKFYTLSYLWIDIRFYLGWTLGLLLAPSPYVAEAEPG